jgi:hypothetical protein
VVYDTMIAQPTSGFKRSAVAGGIPTEGGGSHSVPLTSTPTGNAGSSSAMPYWRRRAASSTITMALVPVAVKSVRRSAAAGVVVGGDAAPCRATRLLCEGAWVARARYSCCARPVTWWLHLLSAAPGGVAGGCWGPVTRWATYWRSDLDL